MTKKEVNYLDIIKKGIPKEESDSNISKNLFNNDTNSNKHNNKNDDSLIRNRLEIAKERVSLPSFNNEINLQKKINDEIMKTKFVYASMKNYDSEKILSSKYLYFFIILLFIIISFISFRINNIFKFNNLPYCNLGVDIYNTCIACPDNSTCINGKFKCDKNFIKTDFNCIENKEIPILKSKMISEIREYLKNENGKLLCNYTEFKNFEVDETEIKNIIYKKFNKFKYFKDVNIMLDLINLNDIIYINDRYSTKLINITIKCKIKIYFKKNKLFIILISLIIFLILFYIKYFINKKRKLILAENYYKKILKIIKNEHQINYSKIPKLLELDSKQKKEFYSIKHYLKKIRILDEQIGIIEQNFEIF